MWRTANWHCRLGIEPARSGWIQLLPPWKTIPGSARKEGCQLLLEELQRETDSYMHGSCLRPLTKSYVTLFPTHIGVASRPPRGSLTLALLQKTNDPTVGNEIEPRTNHRPFWCRFSEDVLCRSKRWPIHIVTCPHGSPSPTPRKVLFVEAVQEEEDSMHTADGPGHPGIAGAGNPSPYGLILLALRQQAHSSSLHRPPNGLPPRSQSPP